MVRALLWDVDGTLAETEMDGHRVAFNQAFKRMNLPWRWEPPLYRQLLSVTGGVERLIAFMAAQPDAPRSAQQRQVLSQQLHAIKTQCYADLVRQGRIRLRPGVLPLMRDCRHYGVRMGIVTTTTRSNVDALLTRHLGERWHRSFATVICADDAPRKKPDPLAYRLALQTLDLAGDDVLALEDSPAGAQAALAAGVPVVVTRSPCFDPQAYQALVAAPAAAPHVAIGWLAAIGPGLDDPAGWTYRDQGQWRSEQADQPRVDLMMLRRWLAHSPTLGDQPSATCDDASEPAAFALPADAKTSDVQALPAGVEPQIIANSH